MTWAQRLKRVFGIDIETCPAYGGAVRIIACIEDPVVIKKILDQLNTKDKTPELSLLSESRALGAQFRQDPTASDVSPTPAARYIGRDQLAGINWPGSTGREQPLDVGKKGV